MKRLANNQRGYIALIAVLIISAVTLAIGLSLNTFGIQETQSGLLKQQSVQSSAFADSCLDEAYLRLERDNSYAGGKLNLDVSSCTITISIDGNDRIITAASDASGVMRQLESRVTVTGGSVTVHYWKELY
jgi:hypothetical protein